MRPPCISRALRPRQRQLACLHNAQRRSYMAVVLGGGITGLTSAWRLVQDPKCTKVVLFEKSNRLGGWINSETIPVEGGDVVFEYGPRTLRSSVPESLPLLCLATNLGLYKDLILTSKTSPAARNRYIYYPDHLARVPFFDVALTPWQNIQNFYNTLKTEPVFSNVFSGLFKDFVSPPRHPSEWSKDESVAEFIERRFGSSVAENLVSAVFHGIYAGDIDQLSAQTLVGAARNLEGGVGGIGGFISGGVTGSMISRAKSKTKTRNMDDFMAMAAMVGGPDLIKRLPNLNAHAAQASTFTFKRGVGQLVEALTDSLKASDKVSIKLNTQIRGLSARHDSSQIALSIVEPKNGVDTWFNFDHVISTIPPVALAETMRPFDTPWSKPPGLTPSRLRKQNYAVTAMVVNLYYPNPNLLPVEGFGYLIPRSIPYEQNPECGLGVIFASSSSVGQGTGPSAATVNQDSAPGTKLTVMLGGHYWDDFKEYPDHDTAVKMARDMLKRHLNITDTPTLARARLQKDAIPQYTVGHLDRMYRLSKTVRQEYKGSLVLAGNWYNGVGVGDCVKQGLLSATYGIGRLQLRDQPGDRNPWTAYDFKDWDLKGGVTMAPVRLFDSQI